MKLLKVHFPIFIFLLICLISISSCTKKEPYHSEEKTKKSDYSNYLAMADKYFEKQVYDSAFYFYNKSRLECKPNENEKIIYSLLKMSVTQQIQGDYSGSETSATEAIPFFQTNTNSYYRVAVYNILGINYKNTFDFNNAIHYYNLAYRFSEDDLQKTIIKNNIAVVHIERRSYERALKILLSLETKKLADNPENNARVLDNIGFCYYKLKNPKALDYLNQSLKIRREIKDNFGITSSLMHFSEVYTETNKKLAKQYASDAYSKASEVNNVDDRLASLKLLIQTSEGKELKETTSLYLKINDSIIRTRQKAKNQFAKIKYDSKKDREENLILKAQKAENDLLLERQKSQNLIYLVVIIVGVGFLFFLYFYLTNKGKREKTKAVYESEIRISKKLHDELANDVFHTMTFAETQDLKVPDKKIVLLDNLEKIYANARNISKENSIIDTGENYENNLKELLTSYKSDTTEIIIKKGNTIDWTNIQPEKKIALQRVLHELMVNMKKYSQASFVVIDFDVIENNIQIKYSDNGIGIEDKLVLKNGLYNAENRIKTIKGTITFDIGTGKGFKAKILFPK
ncbi:tetratricopeptide repeat-containing sensor histidine kinase [Flavobacterium sp. HTF]|uniref:tetratricopeptide repeat-containing sensor histidine kinase n=1 Tax=Flavobacterium sp. HTF TaxID=2170732 RepID=UPI000D5FB538|nr:tetratricopeptide repeat-containing sensor histidine kinase [Flavobacterium sp. HTF]PWB25171.1 hypothetical protein DCO46_09680 [Flavobacterium sp. HTF]